MMQTPNEEAAMNLGNPHRKWIRRGVIYTAALVGLFACGRFLATDAYNALQIVQVQDLATGDCTIPGTPTAATHYTGTLDVYLPDQSFPPYFLPVSITNNLDSVGGSKATEMNNITLTQFSVQLSAPGVTWDGSCPSQFESVPFTAVIAPQGFVAHSVEIIQPAHARCLLLALNPQPTDPGPRHVMVTATILAEGHHGGTGIQSAPFVFVVDVCTGCLQSGYTDPSVAQYRYPAGYPACAALTGTNPYPGDPCSNPGQDKEILCCGLTDASGRAVGICPATPTGSTSTTTSTATSTATSTSTDTATAGP
jgi:hypothetical protein